MEDGEEIDFSRSLAGVIVAVRRGRISGVEGKTGSAISSGERVRGAAGLAGLSGLFHTDDVIGCGGGSGSSLIMVRFSELRFLGPRALPFVRWVNCLPSSMSFVRIGSGADALLMSTGRAAGAIIGGPFDSIVAKAGLKRLTIEPTVRRRGK